MDERKSIIRELEDKKRVDTEARNRLLEELGETLFQRIGDDEPFPDNSGDTPGGILAEYRRLQTEIAESGNIIKSLEEDTLRLRELEEEISAGEEEKSRIEKELTEVYIQAGKALLEAPGFDVRFDDLTGPLRQQEESLRARIGEQENKLREIEEQKGGIIAWVGKNTQMAVYKALLLRNRSALERVYLNAGEKFLSADSGETSVAADGSEAAGTCRDPESAPEFPSGTAGELKGRLSTSAAALSGLRKERRKIGEAFGTEGSPAKRIQGLEKHITHVKGEFPAVCLRLGSLAAENGGREMFSGFLRKEDEPVLERAEFFKSRIAEGELAIEKIKTSISIDNEKAEIEKMKNAIRNQQQRITAAEDVITDLEKQIAESERHIEELKAFLGEDAKQENT